MNSRWFFSSLVRTEDAACHVCPHPSCSLRLQIHSGPCLTPADHALALLRLPTKPQGLHGCGGGGCLSEAEGAVTWGTRGPQMLVSAQSPGVTGAPRRGTGLSAPPFPTSAAPTPESPSVDRPHPPAHLGAPLPAGSWFLESQQETELGKEPPQPCLPGASRSSKGVGANTALLWGAGTEPKSREGGSGQGRENGGRGHRPACPHPDRTSAQGSVLRETFIHFPQNGLCAVGQVSILDETGDSEGRG